MTARFLKTEVLIAITEPSPLILAIVQQSTFYVTPVSFLSRIAWHIVEIYTFGLPFINKLKTLLLNFFEDVIANPFHKINVYKFVCKFTIRRLLCAFLFACTQSCMHWAVSRSVRFCHRCLRKSVQKH